jgi:hypothetical protein
LWPSHDVVVTMMNATTMTSVQVAAYASLLVIIWVAIGGVVLTKVHHQSSDTYHLSTRRNDFDIDDVHYDHHTTQQPVVFHLIPHSHCDAAYKKTFDEYYETEVRNVLNSILVAIPQDSLRRFVWAETIFLTRWWKDSRTTFAQRQLFQRLLIEGRIEIVNGGWVMHDEGITRYDTQIHQMTQGHDRLQQMLVDTIGRPNVSVVTGWQIDPFGPSPFTVHLHDWAGMDFLVLNRMPEYVKNSLKANKSLQFYWEPQSHDIFPQQNTTVTPRILVHAMDTHYASPDGFNWEDLEHGSPTQISKLNVQERTDTFLDILMQRAQFYRTQHVMVPMGGDFTFQNASMQFANMDRMMQYVQSHPERYHGTSLRYSTPSDYKEAVLNAMAATNQTMPVLRNSVAMQPLLGGYYFQNPNLKQMLRTCEIVLRSVEVRLFRAAFRDNQPWHWVSDLVERVKSVRHTVGLMQHHDAITATSYRFVIADYIRRLKGAFVEMNSILATLIHGAEGENSASCWHSTKQSQIIGGGNYLHETVLVRDTQGARNINIDKVVNPQMGMDGIHLTVLNSLRDQIESVVHFVCTRDDVALSIVQDDGSLVAIVSQATPLENEIEDSSLGLFLISFSTSVDSLSERNFIVQVCDVTWNTFQHPQYIPNLTCANKTSSMSTEQLLASGLVGSNVMLRFDPQTLDISSLISYDEDGSPVSTQLNHDFVLYDGLNDTVYSFATSLESSNPLPLYGRKTRKLISAEQGPVFSQVTIEYAAWLRVRYRVVQTSTSFTGSEVQLTVFVGPLPPNVDVASRLSTQWKNTQWYVDENGFLPVQVLYNTSHAVGDGNTRPLVSRTWIHDDKRKLTMLSVDPRAVTSKKSGEMDVFWHRRNAFPGDWWREGNDMSSTVSSIWLKLTELTKEHPVKDRRLATLLSNDLLLLSTDAATRNSDNSTRPFRFPPDRDAFLHLVTLKLSQIDLDFASRSNDAWLDVQIENLSTESVGKARLAELLDSKSFRIFWNSEGLLHSLTYLAKNVDESDGCILETTKGGRECILAVSPRRICSLRIPVSPIVQESSSTAVVELT